ncbi:MAG: PVC-type heme-binding CxxCH protein [Gemmataceae bacterium]
METDHACFHRCALLLLVAVSVIGLGDPPARSRRSIARSVRRQKLFRLSPGLRIELVACEPDVQSPVAMAFDEDGRLWVVEMRDYPNGPEKGQPPEGRIIILEDRDGTGRYRRVGVRRSPAVRQRRTAVEGAGRSSPAAHILYLGDSKRRRRRPAEGALRGVRRREPAAHVCHPILGPDGWIYVSNGLRSGTVRPAGKPDAPAVNLSGMDFRFDLRNGRYETITGMGQYGNTFDDWGRRLVCTNRNHLVPLVMPNHYVARRPVPGALEPRGDNQSAGGSASSTRLAATGRPRRRTPARSPPAAG